MRRPEDASARSAPIGRNGHHATRHPRAFSRYLAQSSLTSLGSRDAQLRIGNALHREWRRLEFATKQQLKRLHHILFDPDIDPGALRTLPIDWSPVNMMARPIRPSRTAEGVIKEFWRMDVEVLHTLTIAGCKVEMTHLVPLHQEELALFPSTDQQVGSRDQQRTGRTHIDIALRKLLLVKGSEPIEDGQICPSELEETITEIGPVSVPAVTRHQVDVVLLIGSQARPCLPDAAFPYVSWVSPLRNATRSRIEHRGLLQG